MHILFLPSWYATADKPWRGMFVRDQALALTRSGLNVGIAFVERRSLSRLNPATLVASHFQTVSRDDDGVQTLRMKGWSTFAQTLPGALIWVQLTRRLVRAYVQIYGRPDVIHGHAALWGGHAAMVCARELGIPYVVTEHAIPEQDAAPIYDGAAAVLAPTGALAAKVDAIVGRAVAHVVPNAVDLSYFHLPPAKRRPTPFTFLAISEGDAGVVRSAFARLRVRNPRVRLIVSAPLPRWQARQWMWDANALIVPRGTETSPLLEAMSTGMPAIDAGMLDEDALLAAMEEVMARKIDPPALRDAARRRFDYPIIAERLRALYENVPLRRKEVA